MAIAVDLRSLSRRQDVRGHHEMGVQSTWRVANSLKLTAMVKSAAMKDGLSAYAPYQKIGSYFKKGASKDSTWLKRKR